MKTTTTKLKQPPLPHTLCRSSRGFRSITSSQTGARRHVRLQKAGAEKRRISAAQTHQDRPADSSNQVSNSLRRLKFGFSSSASFLRHRRFLCCELSLRECEFESAIGPSQRHKTRGVRRESIFRRIREATGPDNYTLAEAPRCVASSCHRWWHHKDQKR